MYFNRVYLSSAGASFGGEATGTGVGGAEIT